MGFSVSSSEKLRGWADEEDLSRAFSTPLAGCTGPLRIRTRRQGVLARLRQPAAAGLLSVHRQLQTLHQRLDRRQQCWRAAEHREVSQLLSGLTRHFLLMTATPHNGKEQDFQLFLALLDGDRFEGRFRDGVHAADVSDLMRRMVKERLLKFDGKPLFRRAQNLRL